MANFQEKLRSQEPRLVEAATRLATAIRETSGHALIVGGFVRDALLGGHPKDIDLEVYGVAPERLEDLLNRLYPGLVNTVGRSFGILKVHLGEDIEFDVSLPRRESKTGRGHKGFSVESDPDLRVEDAARRRDFTINAILADPLTGEVIDPFNGAGDLEKKILRVVDPDTFTDDPLRVYRALQFAARLELIADPASRDLLHAMVSRGDLLELPPERVTEEFKKLLLKAEKPSIGFVLARDLGIISAQYPELQALIGCHQEAEWHPEGDVWTHTLLVINQAAKIIREPARNFSTEEKLEVMVCALCHDFGKPATTAVLEGRIRSRGHEEAGVGPTRSFLARFAFGERVERSAVAVAKDHLKPGMLYLQREKGTLDDASYANAVRKLLKRIYPTSWRVLVASSEADYRGRAIPGFDTGPYPHGARLAETVAALKLDDTPTKPLIQGRDLLARGMKPGPEIGKIIARIETHRDAGDIRTREEALEYLPEFLRGL